MQPKNLNYDDSVAYEASSIAKASAGTIFSVTGYNSHSSAVFVQLFDSSTLPIDTAVPAVILSVPAESNFYYDFGEIGRFCEKGIVICGSTTGPAKTIIGSNVLWLNIQYT